MWLKMKTFLREGSQCFSLYPIVNYQCNIVYADIPEIITNGARKHLKWEKPTVVMVCVAVASDGSKSPLIFIKDGVKLNSVVYQQMLGRDLFPCLSVTSWKSLGFQSRRSFGSHGLKNHVKRLNIWGSNYVSF